MSLTKQQSGALELSLAMVLSGTIGYFVIESGQATINVVFARCLIGSLCLLAYCLYKKIFKAAYFTKRNTFFMILVGLSIVFNWLALFSAYRYVSIGISTTIYHMAPIIIFFAGSFIYKEKMTTARIICLLAAFIGVVLIGDPDTQTLAVGKDYFLGCIYALIAACLYACATLSSKQISNTPPYVIAFVQMLVGVIMLFPFVHLHDLPSSTLQWSYIAILGVVHSAFMYILIYSGYQKLQTSTIAILAYIYPVIAVIIDYLAFGHTFSAIQILGGIMILVAGLLGTLNINLQRKIIE